MDESREIWFIYDGECPLCQLGARYIDIRDAVGTLHLIDARAQPDHPVIQETQARGIDLDKGMVVKFQGNFHHGADALHLLATIGSDKDWINRLNVRLFRSQTLSRLCYPVMKAGRRIALWAKAIAPL